MPNALRSQELKSSYQTIYKAPLKEHVKQNTSVKDECVVAILGSILDVRRSALLSVLLYILSYLSSSSFLLVLVLLLVFALELELVRRA